MSDNMYLGPGFYFFKSKYQMGRICECFSSVSYMVLNIWGSGLNS